jgi:hypothetical protein
VPLTSAGGARLQSSTLEPILWCRPKVVTLESTPRPHLILQPDWQRYDVREAYERAQRRHDPLLSPHGFFRNLARGNSSHAIEFVKRFGPLVAEKLETVREGRPVWIGLDPSHPPDGPLGVNLDEFWRLQLQFRHIVSLWESLNGKEALVAAWRTIANDHLSGRFTLIDTRSSIKVFPWEVANAEGLVEGRPWYCEERNRAMKIFDGWTKNTSLAEMRGCTLDLVRANLNSQSWDGKIVWEFGWEPTGKKLRPAIWQPTLLGTIWEFFGHDTVGMFWRRCPHCQRLFYPKRRDQFYCTPRQQALASKRAYAARRRAEEKKTRRRAGKGAKR